MDAWVVIVWVVGSLKFVAMFTFETVPIPDFLILRKLVLRERERERVGIMETSIAYTISYSYLGSLRSSLQFMSVLSTCGPSKP